MADLAADDRMAGLQGLRQLAGHRLDLAQAGPVAKLAELGGGQLYRSTIFGLLKNADLTKDPEIALALERMHCRIGRHQNKRLHSREMC